MNKTYLTLFFIGLLIIRCKPTNKAILDRGGILQHQYYDEITFNFSFGVPIIAVAIEGQTYNFLLDTGSTTVVSKDLVRKLEINSLKRTQVNGSQGNKRKEDFVILDNLKIGNLDFWDIGAIVSDLKASWAIKCLKIDGIIGANLMSKAIWEIDYNHQIVRVTDDRERLNIPLNSYTVDFTLDHPQKSPKIDIGLNHRTAKRIKFDTGFNGSFKFSELDFPMLGSDYEYIEAFGSTSMGIYGRNRDRTIISAKIEHIEIGNYALKNQVVSFDGNSSGLIGNRFLKNFSVIIDWNLKQINLIKNSDYDFSQLTTFGFIPKIVNGKLYVGKIFKDSESELKGILLNDEILSIDNKNVSNLTEDESCFFIFNSPFRSQEEILLTILRNGKKIEINLRKQTLIH